MKNLNIFALVFLFLAGCAADKGYQQALIGNWQGVAWTVEGRQGPDASVVKFAFEELGYRATLGSKEEKGSFRVEGDKLYTRAEGQQEIMVKIVRLSTDTLEFEMNRGGTKENLVFKRG